MTDTRCTCGHYPAAHHMTTGECWAVACPCVRYQQKEQQR